MIRIIDIALKDLMQLSRDFRTFMFLLIMPIIFTFLFGFAFGGFGGGDSDSRLPVGYISQDNHWVTNSLHDLLDKSEVIRLDENVFHSTSDLEKLVADGDLAAAIIVPHGYGKAMLKNKEVRLIVIADTGTPAWTTVEAELLTLTDRLDSAVRTATIINQVDSERMPFNYAFKKSLSAWDDPPIAITETTSLAVKKTSDQGMALAHNAPGFMLQFAIAGLLTVAQIIVSERKSRTLQRTPYHRDTAHPYHTWALPGALPSDLYAVHHPDHFRPVCLEGGLPARTLGDPAGGIQRGAVYLGYGSVDRHPGAQRGTGHRLFDRSHVRVLRFGWSMGPAGSDRRDLPCHRPPHTGGLGNGRI